MGTYKNILRYGDGVCTGKMNYFSPAGYMGCVLDKDLTAPPGSPSFGDAYIVASGATGDWAGKDNQIAVWNGYNWDFVVPADGTYAFVRDENRLYFYRAGAWAIRDPIVSGAGITKETMALRKTGSSRWYSLPAIGGPTASSFPNGDYLLAISFITAKSITLDRIGIFVSSAGNSGSKARLGIYEDDDSLYPGALLVDAGEVETSSTGFKELTINQTLEADKVYWLVMNSIIAGPYPGYYAFPNDHIVPILGFTWPTYGGPYYGWAKAQAYGALPDPFPSEGSIAGSLPAIFVRVAS